MRERERAQVGFTLIEMLLVISILSVLVSILLPVLTRARGAATSATCKSNLHQWAIALYCYILEGDGHIPRRGQGIRPTYRIERAEDWFNCLPRCVGEKSYRELVEAGRRPRPGDNSIFVCLQARHDTKPYFFSYAMNMYLSPWIRPEPHRLSEIGQPACLVFMADAPGAYSSTVPSRNAYSAAPRHDGQVNLLFLDGHVADYSGQYLGCGVGDPGNEDVKWQTGTNGVNQSPIE